MTPESDTGEHQAADPIADPGARPKLTSVFVAIRIDGPGEIWTLGNDAYRYDRILTADEAIEFYESGLSGPEKAAEVATRLGGKRSRPDSASPDTGEYQAVPPPKP